MRYEIAIVGHCPNRTIPRKGVVVVVIAEIHCEDKKVARLFVAEDVFLAFIGIIDRMNCGLTVLEIHTLHKTFATWVVKVATVGVLVIIFRR